MLKIGSSTVSITEQKMATEIVVRKKGQITIPVGMRKKLKIE